MRLDSRWRPTLDEKVICIRDMYMFIVDKIYVVDGYSRVFGQARVVTEDKSYAEAMNTVTLHTHFISYDNLTDEEKFLYHVGGIEHLLENCYD